MTCFVGRCISAGTYFSGNSISVGTVIQQGQYFSKDNLFQRDGSYSVDSLFQRGRISARTYISMEVKKMDESIVG